MILDAETRARLERMALTSRRRVQGRYAGRHRSRRYGDSMDFADYRPYVPGDDYRRIDHNMRARLGVTLVRLFEAEDEAPVRIIVDRSGSMAFDAKMAVAKAVAGAVAFAALAGGDRVVPYATPGPQGRLLSRAPAGSHLASWPVIESWLESLEPSGEIPDGSVLRRLVLESGVSGPIILVSDLMVPGWKDLISGVGVATGGLILHVLGPSELDPSLAGDLRLVDSETNDEVDFSTSRAAIAAYADRFDRFVSDVATHSRRVGMEYVTVVAGPHALGDSIAAMARLGVLA